MQSVRKILLVTTSSLRITAAKIFWTESVSNTAKHHYKAENLTTFVVNY